MFTEFQNALACAARIFALIEEEPQIAESEHARVLQDAAGRVSCHIPDIGAIHRNAARIHIIKAHQQIDDCRFAASGRSHNGNALSAFHAQIQILYQLPLRHIRKCHMGELHPACRVSRVIADVDQFSDGLIMGFTQLFTGVITILGTLLFMFRENVGITLVVVCITPVSLFVAASGRKRRSHSGNISPAFR